MRAIPVTSEGSKCKTPPRYSLNQTLRSEPIPTVPVPRGTRPASFLGDSHTLICLVLRLPFKTFFLLADPLIPCTVLMSDNLNVTTLNPARYLATSWMDGQ
jgi:hypothetical protein